MLVIGRPRQNRLMYPSITVCLQCVSVRGQVVHSRCGETTRNRLNQAGNEQKEAERICEKSFDFDTMRMLYLKPGERQKNLSFPSERVALPAFTASDHCAVSHILNPLKSLCGETELSALALAKKFQL